MPLDNLPEQLDGLGTTDAGPIPPAFTRQVSRRRWTRRATQAGTAGLALGLCLAVAFLVGRSPFGPAPTPTPIPHPAPIAVAAPTTPFGDTSHAVLSRAGLSAPALRDTPFPRPHATSPTRVPEPPLRAFDSARVLRGL